MIMLFVNQSQREKQSQQAVAATICPHASKDGFQLRACWKQYKQHKPTICSGHAISTRDFGSAIVRISSIFNDWNHIRSRLCHVHQFSSTFLRNLDSINTYLLPTRKASIKQTIQRNIKSRVRFKGSLTGPTISET
ncbi:hypothetical protein BRARA_J00778 [Brassica rapa]|uniref:Uncharacterized protein n=1 Tax=Brassica campestris TaxID=3711 RepID=A0A397XR60_BRACM|nr:hypothetical protein BRARA_J00778 [Brassica rapa]